MPAQLEGNSPPCFRHIFWDRRNHALEVPSLFLLTAQKFNLKLGSESRGEIRKGQPRPDRMKRTLLRDRSFD